MTQKGDFWSVTNEDIHKALEELQKKVAESKRASTTAAPRIDIAAQRDQCDPEWAPMSPTTELELKIQALEIESKMWRGRAETAEREHRATAARLDTMTDRAMGVHRHNMFLADECGKLKSENEGLLAENARLRRKHGR